MAVGRIKLSKRQYTALAEGLKVEARTDKPTKLLRNEILRAHDRPGLACEIDRREALKLAAVSGGMPDVKARLEALAQEIEQGEVRERESTRRLRQMMDARRGAPGSLPPAA